MVDIMNIEKLLLLRKIIKSRLKVLTFSNKKVYNEYNSSRYLISAIIKM